MTDVPQSIKAALSKQQERIYLLHLEKDLIAFIKNSILGDRSTSKDTKIQYSIRANFLKNSYYRLLSHHLCQYYNLQHWNNTSNEIIVTPTEEFNYENFMNDLEAKDSSKFIKLSDFTQHDQLPQKQQHQQQLPTNIVPNKPVNIVKPKMLIKKGKVKSADRTDSSSETQLSDSMESQHSSNNKIQIDNSDTPLTATPSSSDEKILSTATSTIESERASKEALYMKIREKIFQGPQNEDEEDGEDKEDDESLSEESVVDSAQEFGRQDGYIPVEPPSFIPYAYTSNPIGPISIPIPINYNGGISPQHYTPPNSYYNPQGQSIVPPILPYPPNYYQPPPIIPPPNAAYYGYTPSYDKETERRLLNNPYIIIPDSTQPYNRKNKRTYKNNRYSNQNNTNHNQHSNNAPSNN